MTTQIANKDLVLEKIPNPEGESSDYHETWENFALTMNGYEVCGDFESCSYFAGAHQFVFSLVTKGSCRSRNEITEQLLTQ